MDLSKLPGRTTEAAPQPAPAPPPPAALPPQEPQQPLNYAQAPMASEDLFMQGIVSLLIGLVGAYLGRAFAAFALARLRGQTFHTGVNWVSGELEGQEVPYFQLQGMTAITDLGLFLFGVITLLDGALLLAGAGGKTPRRVVMLCLMFNVLAALINLAAMLAMMSAGVMPMLTIIAIIYSAYAARTRWLMLKVRAVAN